MGRASRLPLCLIILLSLVCGACDGPSPEASQLNFPEGEVSRTFELRLRVSETPLGHAAFNCDYIATGRLSAIPVNRDEPAVYRVQLGQFLLHDQDGRLLIAFERPDEDSVHYRSDPSWSGPERAALFRAFEIDLQQADPYDDNSLLREEIRIAMRSNAQIAEVTIPERLRSLLQRLSQGHISKIFLQELLVNPDRLPALLPDQLSGNWESYGSCVTPLRWLHRREGDSITTRSAPLAPHKQNGYDVQSDVQLDWSFTDGNIPSLAAKIYLALSRSLMGSESRAACWVELRLDGDLATPEAQAA